MWHIGPVGGTAVIETLLSLIGGSLGGWWMKAMWEGLKDLERADKQLSGKVTELQILVAGQYVKKESFDKLSNALFSKLDRIEDKLDQKADKPNGGH